MIEASADIKKLERKFLPKDLMISNWETIEPYFKELLDREISSAEDLQHWLADMSELEAAVNEDVCWRQIKMTCDTTDKKLEESFNFFCMEIQPKIQPYADALNKKLVNSPFVNELGSGKIFYLPAFSIRKALSFFGKQIFHCRLSLLCCNNNTE